MSNLIETLENRRFFSVTAAAAAVNVIGPTGGVHASVVSPEFTSMHGTKHDSAGNAVDDSDTGVDRDTAIKITFDSHDNGSIDGSNLYRAAVRVTNTATGVTLDPNNDLSKVITSGGGDVIIISLKALLAANATYTVELNAPSTPSGKLIQTNNGTAFPDTTFTFTTGTYYAHPSADFTSAFSTAATQASAGNHGFTCVTMGPDGQLYAADTQGYIYAFAINSDGTLGTKTTITTIRDHFGGNRLITGMSFKPASTATVMELWVSSGQYRFGTSPNGTTDAKKYANNFTGEIDALSGTGLTTVQPLVVDIPRSVKDHTNNQIVFSPDGRSAYFGVAAMNAMGKADDVWGNRVENIYSATIMQLRVGGDSGIYTFMNAHGGPVNLLIDGNPDTADGLTAGTTHYNIYKGANPLRIYADGIRNDYDMVFGTNGHLYAAINGSSAGGNTPGTPSDLSTVPVNNRLDKGIGATALPYTGPAAPSLGNVQTVEEDTLLDVQNGAYYGHPNAARGEYVLDGGNPTSHTDPYEITGASGYAVGQQPDRNYTLPIYDFGQDYSPDGIMQYKSVGGKNSDLNDYILVARYSSGGDILALKPNATTGAIDKVQARIPGLTDLGTPLDLTEDPSTGNLYVAVLTDELGSGSIQLIKPTTQSPPDAVATPSTAKLVFSVKPGRSARTKTVTLTNTGGSDLVFDPTASRIGGSGRKNFQFVGFPTTATTIAAGQSLALDISGQLLKGQTSIVGATLYLKTSDPADADGFVTVLLRATNANVTA